MTGRAAAALAGLAGLALWASAAAAETGGPESNTEIAKQLQNPVGDLYSFPFQNNTNLRVGPNRGTQNILNVQPVIPIHLNSEWNLITRTILPLIRQPSFQPFASTVPFGTGPTTVSAFLSPRQPQGGWIWGAGPVMQLPTASDPSLGSPVWGAGITGVALRMQGPWVGGVLFNNVWSLGGSGARGTRYNALLVQPFLNYNFGDGWYVGSSPIITANWLAAGNSAWTLPVGASAGRVVRIGRVPVNVQAGAYYNALRPDYGPT